MTVAKIQYLNGPDNPIGWCDFTWNPVTGCQHDCHFGQDQKAFCYAARDRYSGKRVEPTFHPARLDAPAKLGFNGERPWRIFVCSMGDLFGEWVPREWIEAVLGIANQCPGHVFQFLTKNPVRLPDFSFPPNTWVGTTITGGPCTAGIEERFQGLSACEAALRYVSFEPLEAPIPKDALDGSGIDWVIIGACTGLGAFQPEEEWVRGIEDWCALRSIPVFHKDNLRIRHASRRTEVPWQLEVRGQKDEPPTALQIEDVTPIISPVSDAPFDRVLADFKGQEKPEMVLFVAEDQALTKIVLAWPHVPLRRLAKVPPFPEAGSDTEKWAWLWSCAEFRLADVQTAVGDTRQLEQKLRALVTNRILYPDGDVHSYVIRYLRDRVVKLFETKPRTPRASKGSSR